MNVIIRNNLINKLRTIIDFNSDDIYKFYRNIWSISEDIKEQIPNKSQLYQNFKTDINCVYNQIIYVDCEYDENVIMDCIVTLNEIIDYLNL
jgi:hypothetical protein